MYWIEAEVAPCGHSSALVKPPNVSPWAARSPLPSGSVITIVVTGTGPFVAVRVAVVDCPAVRAALVNAFWRATLGGSRRIGTVEVACTTGLLEPFEVTRLDARFVTVMVVFAGMVVTLSRVTVS